MPQLIESIKPDNNKTDGNVPTQPPLRPDGEMLEGLVPFYDEHGQVIQTIHFQAGKLHGPLTQYAAGKKQTVVTYAEGIQHGPTLAYDDDEQVRLMAPYQAGQLDGPLALYSKGQPQSVVNYQAGKADGESIAYHANGKPSLVAHYTGGARHGDHLLYFESGQLFKAAHYKDDKLEGQTVEHYPTGVIREIAHYKDGQLHGTVCTYNEKGKLKGKRYYDHGTEVDEPIEEELGSTDPGGTEPDDGESVDKDEQALVAQLHTWLKSLTRIATIGNPALVSIVTWWQQVTTIWAKIRGGN